MTKKNEAAINELDKVSGGMPNPFAKKDEETTTPQPAEQTIIPGMPNPFPKDGKHILGGQIAGTSLD